MQWPIACRERRGKKWHCKLKLLPGSAVLFCKQLIYQHFKRLPPKVVPMIGVIRSISRGLWGEPMFVNVLYMLPSKP